MQLTLEDEKLYELLEKRASMQASIVGTEQKRLMADPRFKHFNNFIESLFIGQTVERISVVQ